FVTFILIILIILIILYEDNTMSNLFNHEKLHVYQASIEFVVWLQKIHDQIPKKHAIYDFDN
ncbi:MAG: hypothetical protein ACMUIP_11565, partial [bacterium]